MGSSVTAMGMVSDSKFHVLAVDDSVIDRKLIEKLLKTSSFQVTAVDSGSKALELLGYNSIPSVSPNNYHHHHHHQELDVNLVITDYFMPEMTGYDLLKKIKGSKALKNIPVVIMSSENEPARINRCLEEGAEEFFLKPVRLSDVSRLKPHILKTKLKSNKPQITKEEEQLEQQQQQQHQPHEQEQLQLQPQEVPTAMQDQDRLQCIPFLPKPQQEQGQLKSQLQQVPTPLLEQDRLQCIPLLPTPQQEQGQLQLLAPTLPQQSNNNKRKAMEDSLSPDSTRPRYNGITTMV